MYPYHNKIKQRIKNGELIGFEFAQEWPKIGSCLLLRFNTQPFLKPIRPHRYAEYAPILNEWAQGMLRDQSVGEDAVPVTQCKDCAGFYADDAFCKVWEAFVREDDFCSYGKKKDGDG